MREIDFAEITREAIDLNSVARRIVPVQCGATVSLDGYARKFTGSKETQYLVYEAYESMAVSELRKLIAAAKTKFEVFSVGIVHRIGRIEIGESSVVISVAAPHRKAAFAACEWLISELKRSVPIWKKEVYADGESWIEGEPAKESDR